MKKIILLLALAIGSIAQAQIVVYGNNDTVITEGYVYTASTLNSLTGDAKLSIIAQNQGSETVYIQLRMNTIENGTNNTDKVQFCFQQTCYFSVATGNVVPAVSELAQKGIPAGGQNNVMDHFISEYQGDTPGQPVKYNMSLIKVDVNGNLIETIVNFAYLYQPTASVKDITALQNIGISLNNTVVNNQIDVNATTAAKLELFNVNGQIVKTVNVKAGYQSIEASALSTGVYVAKFTTTEGKSSSVRIAKN